MKARTFVLLVGLSGIGLTPLGCVEQPELECKLPRGPFSARYELVEGTAECAAAQKLPNELVGVEQYYPVKDGKQDLSRPSVAIQGEKIGNPIADRAQSYGILDENQKAYGYGEFASSKPSGDFCTVPTLSVAAIDFPEIPATPAMGETLADPGRPAVSMQYQWSNVRFLMTDEIPGQAFDADLTVTADGCTATYRVNAMFYNRPFLAGPLCRLNHVDETTGQVVWDGPPDDRLCDPQPVPEAGHVVGSGINPEFKTHCDETTFYCVLDGNVTDYR